MASAWAEADSKVGSTVERLHGMVSELRRKYRIERTEVIAAVSEQVSQMRTELETCKVAQSDAAADVEIVQRQLAAMEKCVHQGPEELKASVTLASSKLDAIHDGLRKVREQSQLLRTALLGDRMRREERARQLESEDMDLELRLRQVEDTNASLRSDLHVAKSLNSEATSMLMDVAVRAKHDPATVFAAGDMQRLQQDVLSDLNRVRDEQLQLRSRLESIQSYTESEQRRRQIQVENLQSTVTEIEHQAVKAPLYRPTISLLSRPGDDQTLKDARLASDLVRTPRRGHHQGAGSAAAYRPADLRSRIVRFYQQHNPSKLGSVDSVLREYEGAEEELMSALEIHYGAFGYFSEDAR